jgi:glycosyltransferase involved in cell wall biosynthesis
MSRFAIVTSHLTSGDAVSNDVITMHRVLENRGYDARLYSSSKDFEKPKVWPLEEIGQFLSDPDDVLIYHHSFGWDDGLSLLQELKCRIIIKYHNVTPPEFFTGVSAWHEQKCDEGLQQLEFIAKASHETYLSDSAFNMQQLLDLGASPERNFVVPPFHHIDKLETIHGDTKILETYRDGKTNVLCVSRVAPHKNQEALIEGFAVYHHERNPQSRLLIVGREEVAFASYSSRLRELINFLVLDDAVVFAGEVSDAGLKAYYLLSDAFFFASKHEGFSVPLVEAMAMKVPIVSYGAAAVPETVGRAGVVLDNLLPAQMAAALDLVLKDESKTVALGLNGRERYEQNFTNERIEYSFLQALATCC